VKALTLHQPWASLIAYGYKTIETRSWSTRYRGELAIHAGLHEPPLGIIGEREVRMLGPERVIGGPDTPNVHRSLPLGAVVATCELVDVVPTEVLFWKDKAERLDGREEPRSYHGWMGEGPAWRTILLDDDHDDVGVFVHTGEKPYGDYGPGRFAWLLDKIMPVDPPVPARGAQGIWLWTPDSTPER